MGISSSIPAPPPASSHSPPCVYPCRIFLYYYYSRWNWCGGGGHQAAQLFLFFFMMFCNQCRRCFIRGSNSRNGCWPVRITDIMAFIDYIVPCLYIEFLYIKSVTILYSGCLIDKRLIWCVMRAASRAFIPLIRQP